MNKQEITKVLSIIKIAYPNSFNKLSNDDVKALITLWERQFKEYDYMLVQNALDSIISTDLSDFMPTIAKIKEMIRKLQNPNEISEIEAWNLVKKALSNSGYNSEEEFKKLPSNLQKLVGNPRQLKEWCMMDADELNSVVASNFQRSYRTSKLQEQEVAMIPNSVKEVFKIGTNENGLLKIGGSNE